MSLDRFFYLRLDGIEVEGRRCLHRRKFDCRLRQFNDLLLHVDEAPQLAAHEIVEVTGGLVVEGLPVDRRCPLERVLADIDRRRHIRRQLLSRPTVGLLDEHELEIVEADRAELRSSEVEDFVPRRRSLTKQQVHLIVPVQMVLVRPAFQCRAFQELLPYIRVSCSGGERRQPIEAGEYPVLDRTRLDLARPADDARHPKATLENSALGRLEWGHATVRPSEDFRAVVGGEDDDRVVGFANVLQVFQQSADTVIQLRHSGLFQAIVVSRVHHRLILWRDEREGVHARGVMPDEERFAVLLGLIHEGIALLDEHFVERLHVVLGLATHLEGLTIRHV